MFLNKGNFEKAQRELKNNDNNAVAFLFENHNPKKGKLSEVVVTIKDNYATKEVPTKASSKILDNFIPGYNATILDKLYNEGANIVAKVHLDELGLGGTGQYSGFGPVNNVLDKNRISGGSSSGSVSTFTKNIGLAIGSDTGDSVRLPASYNGIVGFKPSYGAISRYGLFAFASSLDTIAYFTHNVSDAIETSRVLYGKDSKDMTSIDLELPMNESIKPNKIAILDTLGVISQMAEEQIKSLKSILKKEKIKVEYVNFKKELLDAIGIVYDVISFSEASSNDANLTGWHFGSQLKGGTYYEDALNTRSQKLGKMVQRRFALGSYYLLKENQEKIFNKAKKVRRLIKEEYEKIFNQYDILIFPSQRIAPLIKEGKVGDWYSNILTGANLSTHPSITIPWIKETSMPIGLSIEGKHSEDKKLLSHALWIEDFLKGEENEK